MCSPVAPKAPLCKRDLREDVKRYLALRRSLGFRLKEHDKILNELVTVISKADEDCVRVQHILTYLKSASTINAANYRCMAIRGFARYMTGFDARTEVPPFGLVRWRQHRSRPYLLSEYELAAFLKKVKAHGRCRILGEAYRCIFGLMASVGLRTGEAARLEWEDVDLRRGILLIRKTKRGRQRYVPLHRSATSALRRYALLRERAVAMRVSCRFFVTASGQEINCPYLASVFKAVIGKMKLPNPEAIGTEIPTPTSLRHRFISMTIADWIRQGRNVDQMMPLLSTFVGHKDPADTYWYFHNTPQLINAAEQKLETYWNTRYENKDRW